MTARRAAASRRTLADVETERADALAQDNARLRALLRRCQPALDVCYLAADAFGADATARGTADLLNDITAALAPMTPKRRRGR